MVLESATNTLEKTAKGLGCEYTYVIKHDSHALDSDYYSIKV